MGLRSDGATRRRRLVVAVFAALSVFVALIAGSSLRPQLAASALPEPAVWTHQIAGAPTHLSPVQPDAMSHLSGRISAGSTPLDKKPFHSMWMTRGRPTSWEWLSPTADWSVLPMSFAPSRCEPGGTHSAAAVPAVGNLLAEFCLLRC
ncbi:hypothetical protein MPRM_10330 [Mycobacterium parmense]|uniref:Uncharacterized protein n=1 Tax=Mycobacterium parmense TaxID=185642 RepID=A0A7I7YRG0_9MYCO|nr:hypothetical protein MPRM_10330 [Mycobacterium parmense]